MGTTTVLYYRREDYAGFWLRLLIDVIDSVAAAAVCVAVTFALWGLARGDAILLMWPAIFFCYFVLLKRSKIGTLGYRVGGVKIVGLDAQPASLLSLTLRFTFMALGPVNYLLDLAWLSSGAHRQALRDKFAQTYIVKRKAEPIGTGRLVRKYYEICGHNFLFREIEEGPATTPDR
jgi:uncharacterized RDD family membrane protein YckC